jgi:hypothetical protein
VDVLSEVLKVVKLQGALFYNGEFSAPWCVNASSARALARQFAPTAEHVIIFHLLTHGRAFIRLESGEQEILNAGDLVMILNSWPKCLHKVWRPGAWAVAARLQNLFVVTWLAIRDSAKLS